MHYHNKYKKVPNTQTIPCVHTEWLEHVFNATAYPVYGEVPFCYVRYKRVLPSARQCSYRATAVGFNYIGKEPHWNGITGITVCHQILSHGNQVTFPTFSIMTSSNGNIFRVTDHLCGNSPVPGEFPAQRSVTRSFDVFFDLRLNKRLSKQSWGWLFETLLCPLWRHRNVNKKMLQRHRCHEQ